MTASHAFANTGIVASDTDGVVRHCDGALLPEDGSAVALTISRIAAKRTRLPGCDTGQDATGPEPPAAPCSTIPDAAPSA